MMDRPIVCAAINVRFIAEDAEIAQVAANNGDNARREFTSGLRVLRDKPGLAAGKSLAMEFGP